MVWCGGAELAPAVESTRVLVCSWLFPCFKGFSSSSTFFLLSQKQTFQIPTRSGCKEPA